jgi:hypothetical protein
MASNIDMHLLGHVVADELYKQEGLNGMSACTADLQNACSHSIVVGALLEHGENTLPEIGKACRNAPGTSGAYIQCYHGLGHGILAYTGYAMEPAVELCKKVGSAGEDIACVGGVSMEMVSGINDVAQWNAQKPKYVRDDDPLTPCSLDFLDDKFRPICYTFFTPRFFEATGGNLFEPTPETVKAAFSVCERIPQKDFYAREGCFGGFGKDFAVIAHKQGDIRSVDETFLDEELRQLYEWCSLAPSESGVKTCIVYAVDSLYWDGENDREGAIRFCNQIPNATHQEICFERFVGSVATYIRDKGYRKAVCSEVVPRYAQRCREYLL